MKQLMKRSEPVIKEFKSFSQHPPIFDLAASLDASAEYLSLLKDLLVMFAVIFLHFRKKYVLGLFQSTPSSSIQFSSTGFKSA